jgi:hypothetical protein
MTNGYSLTNLDSHQILRLHTPSTIASQIARWNSKQLQKYLLQATDGTISSAGPYVVWTPAGGPNGTIVVSDSTYSELFWNTDYGDLNTWVKVPTGKGISYTSALQVLPDESIVMIVDGGYMEEQTPQSPLETLQFQGLAQIKIRFPVAARATELLDVPRLLLSSILRS